MDNGVGPIHVVKWTVAVVTVVAFVIGVLLALWFAVAAIGRYQRVADAQNQVQVNSIVINQTDQLVKVEQQKAQIRIADAQGIAKAQEIINSSLTPTYLTYLAIQAQQEMATHDHTATIYIPVGNNGVPIIATQPAKG